MLRYYKKQAQSVGESIVPPVSQPTDLNSLPVNPSERKKIESYNPNERDAIRRAYLQKGPCQPHQHNFPQSDFGGRLRRFNPDWFDEYNYWLEYSIKEDVAFCLYCYLFKPDIKHEGSPDSFSSEGFKAWNKKPRLGVHEGSNAHKLAVQKSQNLMNQSHSIRFAYDKHAESTKSEYRIRLNASVDCTRFLLRQGLPFRVHDESENSRNKGNFLELLQFYAERNEKVGSVVLSNPPRNEKMIASSIQKEIVHAAAKETIRAIIDDLNDDYFGIIVDESRDVSCKEQMAFILCYVDRRGLVVERFLGLAHVSDTSAISLKNAICSMLFEHNLSLSRVRGQGYDGASNMRGEFNGLKTLVMRETKYAYYVHCFAHQLQLALVFVAKKHVVICDFFDIVNRLLNVIGASCKRRDKLREQQRAKVIESLDKGEIQTSRGLNQELSIKRPGDTRWGSHYGSLLNIMAMYSSIIDVLEDIEIDGTYQEQRAEAHRLLQ